MSQSPAADPVGHRVAQFSEDQAPPVRWSQVTELLGQSEMFWLSTTRTDGRPHVAPLPAVWHDGRLHFCTGADEQKARNIAYDPRCAITTGTNEFRSGTDVVVEGQAVRVTGRVRLHELADLWLAQYDWPFTATEDGFLDDDADGHPAAVYEIQASKVLVFTKQPYSQTRFTVSNAAESAPEG
jgi:general stress protein 26